MGSVYLTQEHYDELIADQKKLRALENAGVDCWEGYDFAMEEFRGLDD